MRPKSLEFLRQLLTTPSPSGHESAGQKIWKSYVQPLADEWSSDDYGNCVATLNPGGSPRLMIAAHADEIGMRVNYIDPKGFVYVRRIGGVDPAILKGQRVTIHGRKGPVLGVLGNVPPHLTKLEGERKIPKIEDLFIDIGAASAAEAKERINVGDPLILNSDFEILHNHLAVARAFDNRIGTFAVAETLRLLRESKKKLAPEINFVSNVMEEVGLFGARQIAYTLKPDAALVVDVTHATDYPSVNKPMHGEIQLGAGPTLTWGGGNHLNIVKRLEALAEENKIPVQFEAASGTTGTDTDAIFWTRGGIPSALISLPLRYMHSTVETISLKDLDLIPQLMAAFCRSLKKKESFKLEI